MRALTVAEVKELEAGCSELEIDYMCIDAICDLAKRGLIKYTCDGNYHYTSTTEFGKLALRVHRAYLISIGYGL